MNAQFCKITAFEANIIPDSNDENDFYSIRKEYKIPFDLEDLYINLDNFVMNELVGQLIWLDCNLKPYAILIVKGYKLSLIKTDVIIFDEYEYEIPFVKITLDENGNPNAINLLEES